MDDVGPLLLLVNRRNYYFLQFIIHTSLFNEVPFLLPQFEGVHHSLQFAEYSWFL